MPSLSITIILLFLLTLPIPPLPSFARGHFTPSAFGFPTALAFIPRHVFTTTSTPRSWEVARCVQYLVWAWAGVGFLQAVGRTVMRLKRGSLKLERPNEGNSTDTSTPGTASNHTTRTAVVLVGTRNYTPKPLLTALALHLISWRLATTLILPDLPGAWKWPFNLTTLIGLGTGLVCSWGEVGRLLMILGITGCKSKFPSLCTRMLISFFSRN